MKRRRYLLYNKLFATPLIAPDDFEQNLSKYSDVNIVSEFDNIQRENKKYIYSIQNDIPEYYNSEQTFKKKNTHKLPLVDGIAIIHELYNDEWIPKEITLSSKTRVEHEFKEGSTHRYVCICTNSDKAYIPMDTKWFFLGNATKVDRPEYYSSYTTNGAKNTTYNTVNYCHIRADIEDIPPRFMYYCTSLKGKFVCPDSVKRIGTYAFAETPISGIEFKRTNKIEELGYTDGGNSGYVFYNYLVSSKSTSVILDFPDSLTKITGYFNIGNSSTRLDYLRIPPNLELFRQYNLMTQIPNSTGYKGFDLVISGQSKYISVNETSWRAAYVIFNKCKSITIEGVEYADLDENNQQPLGTIPYGSHVKEIEINGKKYKNNYYIGTDRGLHYFNESLTEKEVEYGENILIAKPNSINYTEYLLKIDEGTTILDLSLFNLNVTGVTYWGGSNGLLVFPKSIKKIYAGSLDYLNNFKCEDPFNKYNEDGSEYYDDLIYIDISNSYVRPSSQDKSFFIPKNVLNVNKLSIGSNIYKNNSSKGGSICDIIPDDEMTGDNTSFKLSEDNGFLSEYKGSIYVKSGTSDYYRLAAIPKGYRGELHIHGRCQVITYNTNQALYGLTSIIFDETPENYQDNPISLEDYVLTECRNVELVDMSRRKKVTLEFCTFMNTKLNAEIILPDTFVGSTNNTLYYNCFSKITNSVEDISNKSWYLDNDFLIYRNGDKKYFINIPGTWNKLLMEIPEGIYGVGTQHRGSNRGPQYIFLDGSNKYNSVTYPNYHGNLVLPSTIKYITSIGYTTGSINRHYHPEIHIHYDKYPIIYSSNQDTFLREGTDSRPYRICRVPVNAVGYDGQTKTLNESYIYDGCWCNPVCLTAKQISELRFDLVKVSGLVTYNNNPVVNQEIIFTQTGGEEKGLPEDAYKYDHLKEIHVTTDDNGYYELWMKNIAYNVTYESKTIEYSQPISGEFTLKDVVNKNGILTKIVALKGVVDTHEATRHILF